MLQYIQQYWLNWTLGIAAGALAFGYRLLWNKVKANKKENEGIKNGVKAILRHNIKSEGRRLLEQGYCTPEEFEDFEELYQPYHDDLGGNGTAQRVREQVLKLPHHPPSAQN